MFYIVCVSTERSSVRVGCADALAAQAKVVEFEATGIGKVRVFDDAGTRIEKDELRRLAGSSVRGVPIAEDDACRVYPPEDVASE